MAKQIWAKQRVRCIDLSTMAYSNQCPPHSKWEHVWEGENRGAGLTSNSNNNRKQAWHFLFSGICCDAQMPDSAPQSNKTSKSRLVSPARLLPSSLGSSHIQFPFPLQQKKSLCQLHGAGLACTFHFEAGCVSNHSVFMFHSFLTLLCFYIIRPEEETALCLLWRISTLKKTVFWDRDIIFFPPLWYPVLLFQSSKTMLAWRFVWRSMCSSVGSPAVGYHGRRN